jgi:hypothetical protein
MQNASKPSVAVNQEQVLAVIFTNTPAYYCVCLIYDILSEVSKLAKQIKPLT